MQIASNNPTRTLCVKNLSQQSSEGLISNLFSSFGGSFRKIITSNDPTRKDILVEFESEELATKARNSVQGKVIDGVSLNVEFAPPSQTFASSNKESKQRISVLDRIIRPGDVKHPKSTEKTLITESQNMRKDGANLNHQNDSSPLQIKKAIEIKPAEGVSQHNILKRVETTEKFFEVNNGSEKKRLFATQPEPKLEGELQKKLETVMSMQDSENHDCVMIEVPKEVSSVQTSASSTNPDISENANIGTKSVYDLVQKDAEGLGSSKEVASKTISRNSHYNSSKNKTVSRSNSKSRREENRWKINQNSHSNSKSYQYYNDRRFRRSRSRYSSQSSRSNSKNCSRSVKYGQNADSYGGHSQSSHADSYHKKSPRDYDRSGSHSSRRSRSRSQHKREYSPSKDQLTNRNNRNYSSKGRSKSRTRSRSKDSKYKNYKQSYKSRSPGNLNYRHSYRRFDRDRNGRHEFIPKGVLVIEKRDGTRKYKDGYTTRETRFRRKDYSRSRSKDRSNRSYERSRSRDRAPYKGWKQNSGSYRYEKDQKKSNFNNDGRHQYNDKQRNAAENKQAILQQQQQQQQQQPNSEPFSGFKDSGPRGPEMMGNPNQIYMNYATFPNLQPFLPVNYSCMPNIFGNVTPQNVDASLPSYLCPQSMGIPFVETANMLQQKTQTYDMNGQNGQMFNNFDNLRLEGGNLNRHMEENDENQRVKEDMGGENYRFNIPNEINKNGSNTDKNDETLSTKGAVSESSEQAGVEGGSENNKKMSIQITNEFINKNKMKAFINYLVATGDIQGLKEKLNLLEKSK